MKKLKYILLAIMAIIILMFLLYDWEEKKEVTISKEKIIVRTIKLKNEPYKEIKTYFGELQFSKSTHFVAQQSGIISKLNITPGQKIKQGEVLAVYPPINHQLQIAQVAIQQQKTLQDFNRQQELYTAGAVSKVSVEAIKTQLDIEKNAINQLRQVNIIKAPFSGIITQVHANVGQEVGMDTPIFSMAQKGNVKVEFFINQKDISEIKLNAPAYFILNEKKIEGRITKKSIQLDERRKAYSVIATFDNQDIMFVGSTVDIQVETGKIDQSIWVPIDAYRKQGNTLCVYIVKDNNAVKIPIKIGKRNEQFVQVINGLNPEDLLIIAGIDKIKEGTKVVFDTQK